MRNFLDDERAYFECDTCSWGVSGRRFSAEDKADNHELENPGHSVKEQLDDET